MNRLRIYFTLITLHVTISVMGCREAGTTAPDIRLPGGGTYIVNEGGFTGGGNLSFFNTSTGLLSHNVIRNAQNWLFPNDILFVSGKMFVAVNGSDMLAVVDPGSDSVRDSIILPPGAGPGFLAAGVGRVYSANYDGTVSAIDPEADTVLMQSGRIVGFPGDILSESGRVFVSDIGAWPDTGISVKVLDGNSLAVLDSLNIGGGPSGMALAGGKLYVASPASGRVYRVDPATFAIEDSVDAGRVSGDIESDGAHLFVLTPDAVERIAIAPFHRDTVPLISRVSGLYYYALGFDHVAGEIYVSLITTAGGSGEIGRFNAAGAPDGDLFEAGIFPGAFGFFRPGSP
jgi:hypothetical protein